ncbi:hypothetical protein M0813_24744 [Anaeramoeba flamelloides]|uniref:DH domain-containing protein n=1 Tax=Anaeramoeba flamelloides TaxID=1746091 RepID=A0ABQ8Y6B3_9EUKA|nr:hypothetical protein M0813_24744 [Anaeramoeba flamelloides]
MSLILNEDTTILIQTQLRKYISKKRTAKLKERFELRQSALYELLETEKGYVQRLQLLDKLFAKPIQEYIQTELNIPFPQKKTLSLIIEENQSKKSDKKQKKKENENETNTDQIKKEKENENENEKEKNKGIKNNQKNTIKKEKEKEKEKEEEEEEEEKEKEKVEEIKKENENNNEKENINPDQNKDVNNKKQKKNPKKKPNNKSNKKKEKEKEKEKEEEIKKENENNKEKVNINPDQNKDKNANEQKKNKKKKNASNKKTNKKNNKNQKNKKKTQKKNRWKKIKMMNLNEYFQIFQNFEEIWEYHQSTILVSLLNSLNSGNPRIGKSFQQFKYLPKLYQDYCEGYEKAMVLLTKIRKKRSQLATFLHDQKRSSEAQNLDLTSYLILPVQRLPRYNLLLSEIFKHTNMQHPDYEDIYQATGYIERVAEEINEHLTILEQQRELHELQAKFSKFQIVKKNRRLVRSQAFDKVNPYGVIQRRHFFLFNDILIYAGKKFGKYKVKKTIIPHRCWIQDMPDYHKYKNAFLIIGRRKTLTVCALTQKKKDKWIKVMTEYLDSEIKKNPKLKNHRNKAKLPKKIMLEYSITLPLFKILKNLKPPEIGSYISTSIFGDLNIFSPVSKKKSPNVLVKSNSAFISPQPTNNNMMNNKIRRNSSLNIHNQMQKRKSVSMNVVISMRKGKSKPPTLPTKLHSKQKQIRMKRMTTFYSKKSSLSSKNLTLHSSLIKEEKNLNQTDKVDDAKDQKKSNNLEQIVRNDNTKESEKKRKESENKQQEIGNKQKEEQKINEKDGFHLNLENNKNIDIIGKTTINRDITKVEKKVNQNNQRK